MKKSIILLTTIIMAASIPAGCKRQQTTQPTQTPDETSTSAISQTTSDSTDSDTPATESIQPMMDLMDAEYILADSEFENLEQPTGELSDEDMESLTGMVATLRVTNDALAEIDKLEQQDPEYLLNAKAPITTLMGGIKDSYERGLFLEHSDELEQFHRLYMSVLILNYNGADLMTQAMDSDDNALAEHAFEVFDMGTQQYSKLIDYANSLLGHPIPTGSPGPSPTE